MRLCAAVQFQKNTYRWFSQHRSWISFHTRSEVTEKILLKIRRDVQTTPIEVRTSSPDVADKEQFFLIHADCEDETKKQTIGRKEKSWNKATKMLAYEEPTSMTQSMKEFTTIGGNTTSYSMNGIKANARIRVEDTELLLKDLKIKTLDKPHEEVLLRTDRQF